ncbi:MAG: hypothetical protein CVV30_12000 [Methanomicrobiales archaeon HGW-Methanomicrobiales-1]|nr:MAG: hypothetical protein CVV30_12000 [Methanomicrobiales archaeon HGW-Methanomicrobiales-1]
MRKIPWILTKQNRNGYNSPPGWFAKALTSLQVTDARGTIWQPNPSGEGWIFWTGSAWQPGTPPGISGSGMAAGAGAPQKSAKDFNEFKSSLMSVDEFKKISKDVPLAKRPQKWWDLLSILGGVVAAVIWFLYGGIRSSREGLDLITPLLMIAIPIILVWFRADIDQILLPLQPHRKKISKIILIGLGIATPFLTAWILYNIIHISQYPLMQANMVVGTFAAYIITRDPQLGSVLSKKGPLAGTAMIIFVIMLCSCVIAPVMADDCARDPLNAQDCLRTNGYAEVMAGFITTILATLINGPIILQGLLQGAAGAAGTAGVQPPAPPEGPYVGDEREFIDHRGQRRTATLGADGNWVSEEGTLVNMEGLDKAREQYQANQAWMTEQRAKEAADTLEKMDAYAKEMAALKNYKSPETLKFKKEYRKILESMHKTDQFRAEMLHSHAGDMNTLTSGAEWIKYGSDKTIDFLGQITGPAGKSIAKAYKVGTNLGEGLGEGMAEGGNYTSHLAKGIGNTAVDLIGDKIVDKGFGKLGEKLGTSGNAGKFINWLNNDIKVNPDPLALKNLIGGNKGEIAARGIGNAAKGWLKGWGPGYGTDALKDTFIGK